MRNIRHFLLFTLIFLSGCSSLMRTEYQAPPVQIPEQWQQQHIAGDVNLDPWWLTFNDTKLNDYVNAVLQSNNDLTLATLTLQKARLQMGLTQTQSYPQLSGSGSAGTSRPTDTGSDWSDSFSSRLSIGYELDLWGKVSAQMDQAKWSAMATFEDREATAQSLLSTTTSLYWKIGYLKDQLALSQRNIADSEQLLSMVEAKYRLGAVSELDVLEAKRSLESLKATQSQYQHDLVEANNAFAILFNQAPQSSLDVINTLPNYTVPAIQVGVPSELLIRRPDVKSAVYNLKSALASKDVTDLGYLPSISLTGSLGSSSEQLRNLLSNPIAALGADLALPFLQWGEMEKNKAIADLDYQSAIINYRKTLYEALQEVENTLSARQNLLYQAERLAEQYQLAKQSENIYLSQYQNGAISMIEYLNAQSATRNAENALLENRYNQYLAQVSLYLALGGTDIAPLID